MIQAVLNHGDYHPWHVFVEDGAVTCIIDWSSCYAGDPRSDVAEALFHLSPDKAAAFKQGYGSDADDPLVKKYLQLIAAWKVTYRHENNYLDRMPHALRVLNEVLS